jgi:type IV pilus assembly protein PilC
MARYSYLARSASGQRVSGVLSAESEIELDAQLARMELCLVRARRGAGRAGGRSASAQQLADFAYHLATVVEAGLPLLQGLQDLADEDGNPLRHLAADLVRQLREGAQLSDALAEHPRVFPEVMRALIAAGERTGRLELVLRDLVKYLEWRMALRRQIQSALAYPAAVVVGVCGLCVVLVVYVVPNFAGIFAEVGVELPLLTRALLALSGLLRERWLELLLLGGVVGGALALAARSAAGRRLLQTAALHLPILGPLVTMLEMSRFTHNLAVLYSAGIPLVDGLQMVSAIVQNGRIREIVTSLQEEVKRGGALAEGVRRHALVPRMVTRMIAIGETSGRLDDALERASSYFDRELPRTVARNLAVFNTASVVLLGALIGLVGLAIFTPVYQMLGTLNG